MKNPYVTKKFVAISSSNANQNKATILNISKKSALTFFMMLFCTVFSFGQNPFITTWETDNPGHSDDNKIIIPATGDFDYTWEEVGNSSNSGSGNGGYETTITFPSPGTYEVSITPMAQNSFFQITFDNGYDIGGDKDKILTISQWGDVAWSSFAHAFYGASHLEITATDIPDLTNVTSMADAFNGTNISTVPNMNDWDVSNVTNMSYMFDASNFNEDIGNWDVSNVTDMNSMFQEAKNFNQDIGGWDVHSVVDMSTMFDKAENFDQDIGNWNVSNVNDLGVMFSGSGKLKPRH